MKYPWLKNGTRTPTYYKTLTARVQHHQVQKKKSIHRLVELLYSLHSMKFLKRFTYVQMEKALTSMKEVLVMPLRLSVPVLPAKTSS